MGHRHVGRAAEAVFRVFRAFHGVDDIVAVDPVGHLVGEDARLARVRQGLLQQPLQHIPGLVVAGEAGAVGLHQPVQVKAPLQVLNAGAEDGVLVGRGRQLHGPLLFNAFVQLLVGAAVFVQVVDQPLHRHHFGGHGVLVALVPLEQVLGAHPEAVLAKHHLGGHRRQDREQHQHDDQRHALLAAPPAAARVCDQDAHGFTTVRK